MSDKATQGEGAAPAEPATNGGAVGWLAAGFGGLGASVGLISGLSSAAVTLPLVAALFALIGGGIAPFLAKIPSQDRTVIGKLLVAFTFAFGSCLTIGIALKVNHGLALHPTADAQPVVYLKGASSTYAAKLESLCRQGDYEALRQAAETGAQ
ncbi:Uncharacterised protein [Burkholderia pseudomallei]|nr:Uncharacterised protein [Burkholderia pseudomallei]